MAWRRAFPVVLAALVAVSSARAQSAAPLAAKPLTEAAAEQFRACVALPRPVSARRDDPTVSPPPPGLTRGGDVTITEIPTDRGKLYAYRDHGGGQIVCGVAVYGVDPAPIAKRLIEIVEASPLHLAPTNPEFYKLPVAKPARARYFGDIKAEGWQGVMMFERPVLADAPSLEADFHMVLVQ